MSKKTKAKSDFEPLSIYSCIFYAEEEHLFICASSEKHAEELFIEHNRAGEAAKGYVDMERICGLPEQSNIKPGEVTRESLDAIGFVFLNNNAIPIFRHRGKVYNNPKKDKEMERWVEESDHWPFKTVYLFKAEDQHFTYKIGSTKNFYRRYIEKTNLVTPLAFYMGFNNEYADQYESQLKKYLSNFSVANELFKPGEWGAALLELLFELYAQEYHCARPESYGNYSFEEILKGITELIDKCHGESYKSSEVERQSLEKLQEVMDERRKIKGNFFTNKLNDFGGD